MKNLAILSFSIFKGNKGFSIGLLFLFMFGVALIVISCVLPPSFLASLDHFVKDYNMSQASIYTKPLPKSIAGLDASIDGIKKIESEMSIDTIIKNSENRLAQARLFTVEEDGFKKYNYYDKINISLEDNPVMITKYFADSNNVRVGDNIKFKFENSFKDVKVSAIVSTPDSISCCYSDTFWNEDNDFGYLFISRDVFERLSDTKGLSNVRNFLFDENLTIDEKEKALDTASVILGNNVVSKELFEKSKAKTIFDSNTKSLADACEVLPMIIFVIIIICSYLFLSQIVRCQRRKIGLLRALGYTTRKNILIFIMYYFIISLSGLILGAALGCFLTNILAEAYAVGFSIPTVYYVVPINTYILAIILFLIGLLTSCISVRDIGKIDPSAACSSNFNVTANSKSTNYSFNYFKVFTKIIISKMLKNKRRLIISSLSIASCIILSFVAFACIHSKAASYDSTFNKRLNYDLLVYFKGSDAYEKISSIDNISKIEPSIIFTDRQYIDDKDLNLQFHALIENPELIKPADINKREMFPVDGMLMESYVANYFGLHIGDKIKVCNTNVKIDDIACEYVNYTEYISFNTAAKLGYTTPNAAFIKLKEGTDENKVLEKLSEIKGFNYVEFLEHQKATMIDKQNPFDLIFYSMIILSIIIGLIIIINMMIISVNERKYEYATLLALGTNNSKFLYMFTIENLIQYFFALIIASIPCYFAASMVLKSMSAIQQNFPLIDIPNIYFETFGLALIYIIVAIFITFVRIKKLNPAVILNARD